MIYFVVKSLFISVSIGLVYYQKIAFYNVIHFFSFMETT